MADDGFNGSKIVIGTSTQAPLLGITFDESAAEVDVTGAAGKAHIYVAGIPNETISFDLVGPSTTAVGDAAAAAAITWFDGSSDSFNTGVCVGRSVSGALDGPVSTSLTFRRAST